MPVTLMGIVERWAIIINVTRCLFVAIGTDG